MTEANEAVWPREREMERLTEANEAVGPREREMRR
jgi:hypothetical protein